MISKELIQRTRVALNVHQYAKNNAPIHVCNTIGVIVPIERQYILRMLVKRYNEEWKLPEELNWCKGIIAAAEQHQMSLGLMQPFVYITVRSGMVTSETDDEWHVDGFSMRITHLPEQNYIWCNKYGTQWLQQPFDMKGFHPLKHNINSIFQKQARNECIQTLKPNRIYMFDPYVIHRRNPDTSLKQRTMIRVSFLPIELRDDGNTPNSLLPVPKYGIQGVRDFRNKLINI